MATKKATGADAPVEKGDASAAVALETAVRSKGAPVAELAQGERAMQRVKEAIEAAHCQIAT